MKLVKNWQKNQAEQNNKDEEEVKPWKNNAILPATYLKSGIINIAIVSLFIMHCPTLETDHPFSNIPFLINAWFSIKAFGRRNREFVILIYNINFQC